MRTIRGVRVAPVCLALLLAACGHRTASTRPEPAPTTGPFTGTIVWDAKATGDDEEAISMFRRLAAQRVRAEFAPGHLRIETEGGLTPGVFLIDIGKGEAFRLDPERRRYERAESVQARPAAADHIRLSAADGTETICGHRCVRRRVADSPDVREGAVVTVWVAKDLPLPACRYRVEFAESRFQPPAPLAIPVDGGAVLKTRIERKDAVVTWTATSVRAGPPAPARFEIPADFEATR
jgi:hypothetical protein